MSTENRFGKGLQVTGWLVDWFSVALGIGKCIWFRFKRLNYFFLSYSDQSLVGQLAYSWSTLLRTSAIYPIISDFRFNGFFANLCTSFVYYPVDFDYMLIANNVANRLFTIQCVNCTVVVVKQRCLSFVYYPVDLKFMLFAISMKSKSTG